jgi:PAS domain S-box-containing protein
MKIDSNSKPAILSELEKVAQLLPVNIYWLDKDNRIMGGNQQALKSVGAESFDEVIGKSLYDIYPAEIANKIIQHNNEVLATGNILSQEEDIRDITTGQVKYFNAIKAPLRDENGNIIGTIGSSINITEQKEAEHKLLEANVRSQAANQAKSYFMASLGHEFRTPLNHIIGLAEIIKGSASKLTPAELEDYANNIRTSGFDLLELINDVITFSRMETGHFKVEKSAVSLRDVLERVVNNSLHRAEEKHLSLSLDYPESLPSKVLGDSQRIRQVITNLIDNALKFTITGYIKVTVKKDVHDQNYLVISVKDTGIGIPSDKHDLIFERFSQVHSELTDQRMGKYKGVGLGLAIVKQLVELMGGTIRLDSKPGLGSKFEFTLPVAQIESSTNSAIISAPKAAPIPHIKHNHKILVVEDNQLAIHFIEFILKEFELGYDIAKTGQQALDLLEKHTYRFVLMDLGLPDIDGLECIRRYQKMKLEHELSPIIFLTAQGIDEGKGSAREAGINDYLEKPLKKEQLEELLKKY